MKRKSESRYLSWIKAYFSEVFKKVLDLAINFKLLFEIGIPLKGMGKKFNTWQMFLWSNDR